MSPVVNPNASRVIATAVTMPLRHCATVAIRVPFACQRIIVEVRPSCRKMGHGVAITGGAFCLG